MTDVLLALVLAVGMAQTMLLWAILRRSETSSATDASTRPERSFSAGRESVERSIHSTTMVVRR